MGTNLLTYLHIYNTGLRVMSCGWHQNAQPAVQLSGHQLV